MKIYYCLIFFKVKLNFATVLTSAIDQANVNPRNRERKRSKSKKCISKRNRKWIIKQNKKEQRFASFCTRNGITPILPSKNYGNKKYSAFITSAFTAEQIDKHMSLKTFDPTAKTAVADNSATAHIWNEAKDFIEMQPIKNVGIVTVGSAASKPAGIGKVKVQWTDDEHKTHKITLDDVLYMLLLPVNLISVTKLAYAWDADRLHPTPDEGT